jgi:hypothetical protein
MYMAIPRAFVPRPRRERVVTQQVDSDTLLYVGATHQALCLNASAARIWSLCDGEQTVTAIAATTGLEADVVAHALGHFAEAGMLENTPRTVRRMSRRRALMGIGLVAIPIIFLVTAPEARAAGSCTTGLNNGGPPCSNNGPFCCTGVCNEGTGTCN